MVKLRIAFLLPDYLRILEKHNFQVTSHLNPEDYSLCLCKENHRVLSLKTAEEVESVWPDV